MAASDVNEGPVLNLINKRLRALRKKYNKIIQMEEAVSQGKTLNKEQEETLRSKSSVAGAIEELEKLHQPLAVAVAEEIDAAVSHRDGDAQAHEGDGQVQISDADKGSVIEDLLNLLYFGSMFDVKSQNDFATMVLRKTHERGCCLTYDYVTDDDADLLGERDLDLISMLGELMMSRPVDSSLSHKNALQRCIEHAKLWLTNANHPVGPDSNITYGALRAKLNKIMASDYFTTSPEMKAPVEVAAAAESYKSYQVPVQQAEQYEQKEEELENSQGQEDEQSTPVEYQQQQQDSSVEVDGEVVSAVVAEGEGQKDQQQHGPRRFQNYRSGNRGGGGGGRRGGGGGYINGGRGGGGRGGRGYTNGGGRNQYYDQTGNSNYYPRNNYNNFRGRGGRGGNPGGNNNYNQGGASAYVAVGDSS